MYICVYCVYVCVCASDQNRPFTTCCTLVRPKSSQTQPKDHWRTRIYVYICVYVCVYRSSKQAIYNVLHAITRGLRDQNPAKLNQKTIGVHVYVTQTKDDPVTLIDVRLNNAQINVGAQGGFSGMNIIYMCVCVCVVCVCVYVCVCMCVCVCYTDEGRSCDAD